eukprot:CAMPEP_0116030162 /NCGR_PEP_ID=MMETSP0321-20121206/16678_1 /TAXON_ID=163516 /ORGANISM="Leptocylindrus danicus var. danicus, Strain B650" /LENGTH=277 /DNA_ID=CAMNT_0003504891 /DNA_START=219 /DNA_END=1052 /DNA_ORIENTATION=-
MRNVSAAAVVVSTNAEKLGVASDECDGLRHASSLLLPRPLEHGANLAVQNSMNASYHGSVGQLDMQTLVDAYNNNSSLHSLETTSNHSNDATTKPSIRRLRSEGVTLSSSDDDDSLEAIMKPYLALDPTNDNPQQTHKSNLKPFKPTREHGRELSFTECACNVEDVESIFAKRKDSFEKLPRRVPSIHLAKHVASDNSSSFSFDELVDHNAQQQHNDNVLNLSHLKLSGTKSYDNNYQECVDSPKSAMDWLRQLQGESGQVAEAASSKFLTRTNSAC